MAGRTCVYIVCLFWIQKLMTEDTSPILDFYPVDFETDLNGKKQEWEAVVLIPFIEEVSFARYLIVCHMVHNQWGIKHGMITGIHNCDE